MPVKLTQKSLGLAALCVVVGCVAVCGAGQLKSRMQSDMMLMTEFKAHRGEFERLRKMVTEDVHRMSFFSEATIGNVRPEARRDEYRKLLELSPNLEVGADYDGTVRFIFSGSQGLAIAPGWVKGIEFVPEGATLIGIKVRDLDGDEDRKLPAGVYLREIEPRWYVFYQRDD